MTEDHFLAPCWAKAAHAERHLKALHDQVSEYLSMGPFNVDGVIDVDAAAYVATLSIREPPPTIWSLIAGDVVANLRAALDHAVCRLVERGGGVVTTSHAFPILDAPPPAAQRARHWQNKIQGVGPDAESVIETAQPYFGSSGDVSHNVMHSLREISNEDKHRVLLTSYTTIASQTDIPIRVGTFRDIEPIEQVELYANRPLADGDEIIRAPVTITGPSPEAQVGGELAFDASFGAGMVRLSGFSQMRDAVCAILLELSRLYPT
jgi:hypothetical protein